VSTRPPRTTAATPRGRLSRNAQRQPPNWMTAEPREGPTAAASAPTAAHRLTASDLLERGKATRTSAREGGAIIAPPTAWSTRPATIKAGVGVKPQAGAPSEDTHHPIRETPRGPTRCAKRPA